MKKRCKGGCGGIYFIRHGNMCRGCERRLKSKGQSIESMFERLSVSSPIVNRAIMNSNNRRRLSNKEKRFQGNSKKLNFGNFSQLLKDSKQVLSTDLNNMKREIENFNHRRQENVENRVQRKKKNKVLNHGQHKVLTELHTNKVNRVQRNVKKVNVRKQELSTELNTVKREIEKIECEIHEASKNEGEIDLPQGALSLKEYEDALVKGELKYGGKSTPREKYDAGWCFSLNKKKWIKYRKKGEIVRKRSERMEKILCLQTKLIPLTKRQASIIAEISALPSLQLTSVESTKSNEPVTNSDILLVFDTNCYLHLDGPRTILECAVEIAKNKRYENVSIMIPREVNCELDRLKTPRYRREWKCRRCRTFVRGKTVCVRCGMPMPYVIRAQESTHINRNARSLVCREGITFKKKNIQTQLFSKERF